MTLMMGRRGEPRIDTGRLKKVAGTGTALDRDALDVESATHGNAKVPP